MHRDEDGNAVCRCGHRRHAHEHYRSGTECALCPDCPRFRLAPGLAGRLAATLRRHLRP
jgi:hypothetical protein